MNAELFLIRHGQSQYNLENRFTGWVDVALTAQGEAEALATGKKLKAAGFAPDIAFTSNLQRAQKTLAIVLKELGLEQIPILKDKALNERHYGDLQHKNKAETEAQFGKEQVHIWRRSYDIAPPGGESLKTTGDRTLPYFHSKIIPELHAGKKVLIVAHGNSLRSIVKDVEHMTPEQILKTELATGEFRAYDFDTKTGTFKLK